MHLKEKDLTEVDDNTPIWRYMSFSSFYSLLLSRSLFFSRLDNYSDSLEGSLPDSVSDILLKQRSSFDYTTPKEAEEWMTKTLDTIRDYKQYTLANSWSMNENENYAMWKIYLAGQNDGVAIRTTVGKYIKCLDAQNDFTIHSGAVNYKALEASKINVFTVSSYKRPTYEYEQEYRGLILHQFDTRSTGIGKNFRVPRFNHGALVPIVVENLIDQLYISPFANASFPDVVSSLVANLLPGFDKSQIIKSGIKDR